MKPKDKLYKVVPGIVVVIIIVLILGLTRPEYQEVFVKVPHGLTPIKIAEILKKEKIIRSKNIFLTLVWLTRTEKKFKPGIYKLNNKMSNFTILRDIVKGNTYKIKITVPEGFLSKEIAELLEDKGICSEKEFLKIVKNKKLEGYLFPETYFFEPNSKEEDIAEAFNSQFGKIFTNGFSKRARELGMTDKDVVVLASIIEKEAKRDEERPLISAVFHNRLKKRWNLESCATVLYALGKHKEFLTYKDLEIDSPFNTYINPGLPPAPISNPGFASIKAALYPASTDDMFFVADGSGTHKFSKYAEEHNSKKRQRKKKR
ncbi:MAG: endolytic transglycosylase MltG [Elusimicrobia bacterium]|nr:endolytic transglycosylase MltG [Elusimicrobiota bacterium]